MLKLTHGFTAEGWPFTDCLYVHNGQPAFARLPGRLDQSTALRTLAALRSLAARAVYVTS